MMNIDADKFLYDLAQAESSHRPHITSASGSFLGSYQMGKPILQDMGSQLPSRERGGVTSKLNL